MNCLDFVGYCVWALFRPAVGSKKYLPDCLRHYAVFTDDNTQSQLRGSALLAVNHSRGYLAAMLPSSLLLRCWALVAAQWLRRRWVLPRLV